MKFSQAEIRVLDACVQLETTNPIIIGNFLIQSPKTVTSHFRRMIKRSGIKSSAGIVIFYMKLIFNAYKVKTKA